MKLLSSVCALCLVGSLGFGDVPGWARARKYAMDQGAPIKASRNFAYYNAPDGTFVITKWNVPGVVPPSASQLAAVQNPEVGALDDKDIVVVSSGPRAKTTNEKVVEAQEASNARHAAKPVVQKQLEQRYLRICSDVLKTAGDPRGTNLPPVSLSVPELYTMLESIESKGNNDKKLATATHQLALTLYLLDKQDPNWFATLRYDEAAGE